MAYNEWKNETWNLDGYEKAMQQLLDEYGTSIMKDTYEVFDELTKELPKKLKQETLAKGLKRRKGGKHYANGWRARVEKTSLNIYLLAYNVNKPQLTHLLENGHLKVNGVDRVDGKPHIAPVSEWAEKEVIERVEKRLSE